MKQNSVWGILLIIALLTLSACSDRDQQESLTGADESTNAKAKAAGGEQLHSVRAEYSFCYGVENPDPTLRSVCESEITFKECKEWENKEQGSSNTFFYAVFSGGEPTIPGRTANYYRMKIDYGDDIEQVSDEQAVFKDRESEFMLYDQSGCYPKATIEILNADDEVVGKKSFDYTI